LLKPPKSRERPPNLPLPNLGLRRPGGTGSRSNGHGGDGLNPFAAALFEDEKDVFILRARGSGLQDANLKDGDLVVVKRTGSVKDGDMVAVWSRARQVTLLRYFYQERGTLRLQPADPEARPEFVRRSEIEIRGTVLAIIRQTD
jgi:SOS-response transcriptional repressor LexA